MFLWLPRDPRKQFVAGKPRWLALAGQRLHHIPMTVKQRKRRIGLIIIVLVGIAIAAMLAGMAAILTREFDASEIQVLSVSKSLKTRENLRTILSLHQDVETGQRGYVLTGNEDFLAPYSLARGQIDDAFSTVASLSDGRSPVHSALPRLRALSNAKLSFVDQDIALVRTGRMQEAAARIATGEGRRRMDALRSAIQSVDTAEGVLLATRNMEATQARTNLRTIALLLNGALILLLGFAALAALRALRLRAQAVVRAMDQASRQEAVFDGAKDAMLTINPSGSIESLNPAAAQLFGYQSGELMRRDVGILFEVAPDRGLVETFLKRLEARRAKGNDRAEEFWARRRDGTTFLADVTVSPVNLVDGHRYLAVLRDVTERRQVERMKTEFVSTVSHELRTPLTSIAGSLGLLSGGAGGDLSERAARLVDIAYSNCQRLVRLINDILDIEKIESGQMVFDNRSIDLVTAIEQSIVANTGFAETHRVTMVLADPGHDATVIADPDRLAQVVTNLLSNAVKFSPTGGVVELAISPLDRRWRVDVADRGPGIPTEFRDRIFAKFSQADSSDTRAKGGTGLGLSIARELTLRMGGAIGFEDRQGGGTRFFLDLPADGWVDNTLPQATDRSVDGLPVILHVDDDPDMLQVIHASFEGKADIRSAKSVEAARSMIRLQPHDAAILDIGMADGSGLDLLPLLNEMCPTMPILIFTAQDVAPGLDDRVDVVFVKSRATLERLVERTLELCNRSGAQP